MKAKILRVLAWVKSLRRMTNATKANIIAASNGLLGLLIAFNLVFTQTQLGAIDAFLNTFLGLFVVGTYQASVKRVSPEPPLTDNDTHVDLLDEHPGVGRLGRHVEHDPRSRAFGVTATTVLKKVRWRRYGNPFNQGQLGSCTGNAITGILNTSPFHKSGSRIYAEKDAVAIYEAATLIDNITGQYPPTDTGSSGLAVCKAAKAKGYISAYRHAFGLQQALSALMSGPVITGVDWYEGFDTPDASGLVAISGAVRGGHEFEVIGYDPSTGLVEAVNSWGAGWGVKGHFFFTADTWGRLLSQQGDVTVPIP